MPVLLLQWTAARVGAVHEGQDLQSYDLLPAGLWLLSALLLSAWLSLGRFEGSQRLWQALLLYWPGILVQARMMGTVAGLSGLGLWIQPLSFFWLGLAWTVSRQAASDSLRPCGLWHAGFSGAGRGTASLGYPFPGRSLPPEG